MTNIPGRPFTDLLGEMENGQLLRDLTEAVYKITAAVMDTRKAGKLKLTLEFQPTGKGTVNVNVKYDAVEPEHDRQTTTFFVGQDFSLLRRDPNQPDLPLRQVETPDNEPVKINE